MARSIRAAGDRPGRPLTVRVEARPGHPERLPAGRPPPRSCPAVKQMIGLTVACKIVGPNTLERSVGKLQRIKDLRRR